MIVDFNDNGYEKLIGNLISDTFYGSTSNGGKIKEIFI